MDRNKYLTGAALLFVSASIAFGAGSFYFSQQQPESYSRFLNATVNADQNIRKVDFDSNSIKLMFEDQRSARMYIDKDGDGSFDIELEDLKRDGKLNTKVRRVTFGNKTYALHFRYSDDETVENDAWLTLYQIQEIR